MDKYYIKLLTPNSNKKWNFKTLESRNRVYDKVCKKFEKERASQIPFIEVDIGTNTIKGTPSITFPLRLKIEAKDEVIKYIESLS